MDFKLTINMDNAAFVDDDELVVDLLQNLVTWMRAYDLKEHGPKRIVDVNGNTVGQAEIIED